MEQTGSKRGTDGDSGVRRVTRGRTATVLWLAWAIFLGFATRRIFTWHLDYFHSPGPAFYRAAAIAIPSLGAGAWVYAFFRRKGLRRYEPLAFVGMIAAAYLRYEPRALLVAIALFAASCAIGNALLPRFELKTTDPADRIGMGFAAGAGILSMVLLVLGLFHALYAPVCAGVLAAGLILGDLRSAVADLVALNRKWRESESLASPVVGVAIFFGWIAAVCTLMIALSPVIVFDSVATHLPSVEYYASTHTLQPVPGIDYSYFPQGVELLWTLGHLLAGVAGAQMISALFFVVFLVLLMRIARDCGLDDAASVAAAVFVATTPFLHWTGSVMKNDFVLGLFEAASLIAFLRWFRSRNFRWILAGCFFLALAFHVKYIAVFAAPPLILFFAWAAWQDPPRWKRLTLAAAVLAGFAVLWPMRAFVLTGNPAAPERIGRAAGGTVDVLESDAKSTVAWHYVKLPWEVLFEGDKAAFESPLPNPAGILLIAFLPLGLLTSRLRPTTAAQTACLVFAVMHFLYWGWVISVVRYAILPFALTAIPIAAWIKSFSDAGGRIRQASLIAVETYSLLVATMGLMIIGINGPQIGYFAGRLNREQYLRAAMQAYGAVEFLHHVENPHARVFGIKNLARAYAPDPHVFQAMWCAYQRPCRTDRIVKRTLANHPEYLIAPEDGSFPSDALKLLGSPEQVYRDPYFSVYHFRNGAF
jgi:hypothetical protein